jgi:GntR family transcriptional regulator, rspAB operon transcriptional repressor
MLETVSAEAAGISQNLKQPSLADKAYHLILDQLLRGSLPAGSVLSRRKLAEQFQMSLVPVAQALQRLEIEGLLESRPRAGTRVKVPTPDEIRGRFELREALECQSARLCAERSTFQERLELRRLAMDMDALYAKLVAQERGDDWAFAVHKYHVDLHMRIAVSARSELLRSEIEKSHVLIFNWFYDTVLGQRILPPNFHEDLIGLIVEGNPQKAEEGMRAHVIYGLKSIQRAMEPLQARHWRVKQLAIRNKGQASGRGTLV